MVNRFFNKGCHVPRLGVSPLQGESGEFDSHTVHKFLTYYFRDVAQSGSAPGLGPGGPRFESWYPDNYEKIT